MIGIVFPLSHKVIILSSQICDYKFGWTLQNEIELHYLNNHVTCLKHICH